MRKIVLRVDRKHSAIENAAVILDQGKQQAIFILLFAVLYIFRDLADASIPDIVFSGLCAIGFILTDAGTGLGLYMFTTALTVPQNEIILFYIIILLGKMFLSGKVRVNGKMVLITVGMLMLQLVNMALFSTYAVGDVLYYYITRMLIIIVPLFWFDGEYSAEDFRSALMCYVAGVILGGTVTMLLTAERITWEALLKGTGGYRLGKTYATEEGMQTTYNANQLAVMFTIASAIILQQIDRKRMSMILGIALLGYSFFLLVLTRSRTGLLTMAMIIVIYYFVLVIRRKKVFAGILLLGVISAMVFMVVTFIPGVVERVIDRFVGQEDITNGRADLFVDYLQAWVNDPWCFFFGYGIGNAYGIVNVGYTPHNAITDVLISWGIVGLFIVSVVVVMCYHKGIEKVNKKERIMAILPALVALVASMAGQYLETNYPHPRLCFLFLAAKALEQADLKPGSLGKEK